VSDEEEAYSTCDLLSLWVRKDTCIGTLRDLLQDEEYFGGHRETVLARDSHLCRIPRCTSIKRGKQSLAVHHRVSGNNNPDLMITLCLGHHAMVTRTQMLRKEWPELLRVLWREQHPEAHEQTIMNFCSEADCSEAVSSMNYCNIARAHLFDWR
jgi:hypothetical protein